MCPLSLRAVGDHVYSSSQVSETKADAALTPLPSSTKQQLEQKEGRVPGRGLSVPGI